MSKETKTPLEKALQKMNKASDNLSETVNGITGTNVVTVYSVLKSSGVKFDKSDITKIGLSVATKLRKPGREKMSQPEDWDGKILCPKVYVYEESELPVIEESIVEYYSNLQK